MSSEQSPFPGTPGTRLTPLRRPSEPRPGEPPSSKPQLGEPPSSEPEAGLQTGPEAGLPVMPGFREMALRRRADEQTARMAEDRGRLVRELAEQRQGGRLSPTEVGARMGTSQPSGGPLES